MRRAVMLLLGIVAAAGAVTTRAGGQVVSEVQVERGPRFLAVTSSSAPARPVDAASVPLLRRRITLKLEGVERRAALAEIANAAGLELVYSDDALPTDGRVRLVADQITVAAALTEVLLDAGVDIVLSPNGSAALVKRTAKKLAQTGSIAGRVTDASTQQGVPGVRVSLVGTRWATSTGSTGSYRLAGVAAGSYTLVTRRLGYRASERAVVVEDDREVTLDVALESVPSALNEVVVTATGEQRRLELGHVVGRINADSVVREAPVSTVSELLTARVPGLQVFQSQGTVGGEVSLRIRGPNSLLLSNEPIVIVDGVRYTTAVRRGLPDLGDSPGAVERSSPLNDLNINNIESIEVVKGPSAATLYGTDAASGVIVITTKRGKPGQARWNVFRKGGSHSIPKREYPNRFWGWGKQPNGQPYSGSCDISAIASGSCTQDSVTVVRNPLNDEQYTIFGTGHRAAYGGDIAGGRQDFQYYFSAEHERNTGPIQMPTAMVAQLKAQRGLDELPKEWLEPNAANKVTLQSNVTALIGSKAEVVFRTGYMRGDVRSIGVSTGDAAHNPYLGMNEANPNTPDSPYGTSIKDPLRVFMQTSNERSDRWLGNVTGRWSPWGWLAARAVLGIDMTGSRRYALAPPDPLFARDAYANRGRGVVEDTRGRQTTTTADLGMTATVSRGALSARTAVGAQYTRSLYDMLGTLGEGLPFGGASVQVASTRNAAQQYSEDVVLGGYWEQTFGVNERLFLTGALRADGASAFGQDFDAAVYPKAGASWLISEEPFLPRIPAVNELRLRYAYGASGRQPKSQWARPEFFVCCTVLINGQSLPFMGLRNVGNPDLSPERVREHEFGSDATLFARRLALEATWYRRRTSDAIIQQARPFALQGVSSYTNLGLITQRGFETSVNAHIADAPWLSWRVIATHSFQANELVDIGTAAERRIAITGSSYVEGYPLGSIFVSPILGWQDQNGDGVISTSEVQFGPRRAQFVGQSVPPRSQSLTSHLGLLNRRLRVSAAFERKSGHFLVSPLRCYQLTCRASVDKNTPFAEQVAAMAASASYTFLGFEGTEPGDFTRLREVTAAVDLPLHLTRRLGVGSATLALTARNVALWTDFKGPDPESGWVSDGFGSYPAQGIPQSRTVTVRLDVQFGSGSVSLNR